MPWVWTAAASSWCWAERRLGSTRPEGPSWPLCCPHVTLCPATLCCRPPVPWTLVLLAEADHDPPCCACPARSSSSIESAQVEGAHSRMGGLAGVTWQSRKCFATNSPGLCLAWGPHMD